MGENNFMELIEAIELQNQNIEYEMNGLDLQNSVMILSKEIWLL